MESFLRGFLSRMVFYMIPACLAMAIALRGETSPSEAKRLTR
jgi:hypothetical protein